MKVSHSDGRVEAHKRARPHHEFEALLLAKELPTAGDLQTDFADFKREKVRKEIADLLPQNENDVDEKESVRSSDSGEDFSPLKNAHDRQCRYRRLLLNYQRFDVPAHMVKHSAPDGQAAGVRVSKHAKDAMAADDQ